MNKKRNPPIIETSEIIYYAHKKKQWPIRFVGPRMAMLRATKKGHPLLDLDDVNEVNETRLGYVLTAMLVCITGLYGDRARNNAIHSHMRFSGVDNVLYQIKDIETNDEFGSLIDDARIAPCGEDKSAFWKLMDTITSKIYTRTFFYLPRFSCKVAARAKQWLIKGVRERTLLDNSCVKAEIVHFLRFDPISTIANEPLQARVYFLDNIHKFWIFKHCCKIGDLEGAKKMYKHIGCPYRFVNYYIAKSGIVGKCKHADILLWMLNTFGDEIPTVELVRCLLNEVHKDRYSVCMIRMHLYNRDDYNKPLYKRAHDIIAPGCHGE
jgi:hypothetical protein